MISYYVSPAPQGPPIRGQYSNGRCLQGPHRAKMGLIFPLTPFPSQNSSFSKVRQIAIFWKVQYLVHRYLTYQNFYTSVKMLNFWCENLFLENQREKVDFVKDFKKSATKWLLLKTKGEKSVKSLTKIAKLKKMFKFICYWLLISKILLKFLTIFSDILRQNREYPKNDEYQRHFLKFLFSGKKEDIGKFQRIFGVKIKV